MVKFFLYWVLVGILLLGCKEDVYISIDDTELKIYTGVYKVITFAEGDSELAVTKDFSVTTKFDNDTILVWTVSDDSISINDMGEVSIISRPVNENKVITLSYKVVHGELESKDTHTIKILLLGEDVKVTDLLLNGGSNSIYISQNSKRLLPILTFMPSNAKNKEVVWSIEENELLSLEGNLLVAGEITGDSETGRIKVTTQDGSNIQKTFDVTITSGLILPLSITVRSDTGANRISVGSSIRFLADIIPVIVSDSTLIWSTNNESVGTITANGIFTAVATGSVTITAASVLDQSIFGTFSIEVKSFGAAFGRKNYRYYHARYDMMNDGTLPNDPEVALRSAENQTLKVHGWKNDIINAKLVTWTAPTEGATISVEKNDLTLEGGSATISASDIKFTALKYIFTNTAVNIAGNFEYYNESNINYDGNGLNYYADCLYTEAPVIAKEDNFQPYWININVPKNATPGIYKGQIDVNFTNGGTTDSFTLNMEVEVLNIVVPDPADRKFVLHTWTHPQSILHSYYGCFPDDKYDIALSGTYVGEHPCGVSKNGILNSSGTKISKLWTDEHLAYYRPVLEEAYKAGQRNTFANLVKDPWPNDWGGHGRGAIQQTYYSYDDLVIWKLNGVPEQVGSWEIDLTYFEKYVTFAMSCGLDQWIDLVGPIVWSTGGQRIFYYDVADNHTYKIAIANVETSIWQAAWEAFFDELVPLAIANNWFEKIRISVDERGIDNIAKLNNNILSKEKFMNNGKMIKSSAAGNSDHNIHATANSNRIQFFSYDGGQWGPFLRSFSDTNAKTKAEARKAYTGEFLSGNDTTFSTTVNTYPSHASNGLPAESQYFGWYAARIGFSGHLKWAFDSWSGPYVNPNAPNKITAFPLLTADNKIFPAGDASHIYPGDKNASPAFIRSSVRQELAKEGYLYYDKILEMKRLYPGSVSAIDVLLGSDTAARPTASGGVGGTGSTNYRGRRYLFDYSDKVDALEEEFYKIVKVNVD